MSTEAVPAAEDGALADRLRRIEAVTDSALAHLDVEELLVELLDRVRELLSADTAAVLLLDPSARYLVATAARGIEEEVRQGVRIPIGKGFAGRIAALKRPVYLDRVDHSTVLNPILREKGIRSLLGVPLVTGGRVIGVLHVGTLTPRRFTPEDTELLQLVGDRVALATDAGLARAARTAATSLQRSLLPASLPAVPGLEIAARYVPGGGGEIGGDWYDVFDLPSGEVCVVVGDVVGSGLTAAVAMGRLRTALRAYALQIQDPAELLHAVDVQVRHFEPDVMATALCAVLDPTTHLLRLSCAGHPPPVLAPPRRRGRLLDVPPDVPLGVELDRPRRTTELSLPAGHGLLLYTDGLIERRGVALDAGFDALRAAVRPGTAEEVCSTVMQELLGGTEAADDVALLMVLRRFPGDVEPLELQLPARAAELPRLRIEVRRWAAAVGAAPEEIDDLAGAVAAACAAVIEQAHRGTLSVRLHTGTGGAVAAEVGAPGTGGATVTVRRTFAGLS